MAVNPKSLENLKPPYPPGVSGNPGGVPRGTKHASPRRALLRLLGKGWEKDTDAESDDDKLGAESIALAKVILEAARNGDPDSARAVAMLIDQAEGKPQERVEHSGEIKRVTINLESRPSEIETP